MTRNVKRDVRAARTRGGRPARAPRDKTKISSKHQVTIPRAAFRSAGLQAGDTLRVEANGAGRIVLTRVDELIDRYAGCVADGAGLRERVEGLRREWR